MPYLWRLFQCIRVYRDTGNQGQVSMLAASRDLPQLQPVPFYLLGVGKLSKHCRRCVQVFNAMKYGTAFPVIIFSAMKYQVPAASWVAVYKPLWLGAALLNSSFSYFWDIERDWEIQCFTSPGKRSEAQLWEHSEDIACFCVMA